MHRYSKPIDIAEYRALGKISTQRHPTLPLTVCKYTRQFQQTGEWTDVMLGMRGAVYDDNGIKVSTPLNKFFNPGEWNDPAGDDFAVFDKLDGTCIVAFLWEGQPIVHTLGSFVSQQAKDAHQYIERTFGFDWMWQGYTYVFEWLDPANFVTLRWQDDPRLTQIFVSDPDGNECMNLHWPGHHVRQRILTGDHEQLRALVRDDEEGFVLSYAERHLGQHRRLKIKGERYLALHRMVWGLSEETVWESLYQSSPAERDLYRATLDEEARAWFDAVADRIQGEVDAMKAEADAIFARDVEPMLSSEKRLIAGIIKQQPEHFQPYLFLKMNGKRASDDIFAKLVRPKGATAYAGTLEDAA